MRRIRLQLDLTEDGIDRIDNLRSELGVKSNTEVIRTAVKLLEWFVAHDKAGDRIFAINLEGNEQRQVELIVGV